MLAKPISARTHCLIDYALAGSLLVLPRLCGLNAQARQRYAAEAAGLLAYVGTTQQPLAILPLIPFSVHGKIDPFNILFFAAQTLARPFRRERKAALFNLAFTSVAAVLVLFTDFSDQRAGEPRIAVQAA